MLIYRIVDRSGYGPFRPKFGDMMAWFQAANWVREKYMVSNLKKIEDTVPNYWNCNNHPLPEEDGIRQRNDDFCGFVSIEQMKDWFCPPIREAFVAIGCKMRVYEASRFQVGKRQVVFEMSSAKLIKTISIPVDI